MSAPVLFVPALCAEDKRAINYIEKVSPIKSTSWT